MTTELRDMLEQLAERGTPAGAATVTQRALETVASELGVRVYRQHRPARRALRVLTVVALAAVVCATAGVLYLRAEVAHVKRVNLEVALRPAASAGSPTNILLVGSDTRAHPEPGDAARFGTSEQVGGARADIVMVVHIDPAARQAWLLSIPRDLWVPIAGTGHSDRINTASDASLIATVHDTLGIAIDHFVEVDFSGFRKMVAALGGVKTYFPSAARDTLSGLDIAIPGCITLGPDQALALARSRHFEFFDRGAWHADPTGDLGRIQRQQGLVRNMLAHALAVTASDPLAFNRLLRAATDAATIDSTLTTRDVVSWARALHSIGAAAIQMRTLPVRRTTVDGASVLTLDPGAAEAVASLGHSAVPPGVAPLPEQPHPDDGCR